MHKTGLLLLSIGLSFFGVSQKKELDHTAYNDWKSLSSTIISNDGRYVSYEINPHRGDGFLYIVDITTGKKDSIPRGKNAKFTGGNGFLVFEIDPGFDTLRNLELNKVDKKKWSKDTLAIYSFANDSIVKIPKVESYGVNDKNDWYYYIIDSPKKEKKKKCFFRKKQKKQEYTTDGKTLYVFDGQRGRQEKIDEVTWASFSENGTKIGMIRHRKYKADSFQLNYFDIDSLGHVQLFMNFTDIDHVTFDDSDRLLTFITSVDSSKTKNYRLHFWDLGNSFGLPELIVDTVADFMPSDQRVSKNYRPRFTKSGEILYFGVADKLIEDPKDTLLESEKVKLDLWHHQDKRLQPQQLKELKRDERETNLYVYHTGAKKIVRLSNDTLKVRADEDLNSEFLIGVSNEQYAHMYNWTIPYPEDVYLVSVETGEHELLFKGIEFGGELSPAGKYYTYFDPEKMNHYALSLKDRQTYCLTCKSNKVYWQSDVNGMPMTPYPLGIIGWKKGEDKVWIQSEFDIWEYTFSQDTLVSVTGREGETQNIKMSPQVWSRDSIYIDYENVYINGFDENTKGEHFYSIIDHGDHSDLNELQYFDAKVTSIRKSEASDVIIYRKETFTQYPDLYKSTTSFSKSAKISTTNPQMSEYNWGTVELIDWTSYEGVPLEGLLYKPEDFDPAKSYPLLVYYYELKSNSLHQHYVPKPTASIIYPAEYASAGYIVFIPDIRYTPGYPARSAYDCIMSGTDRVIELVPNIDTNRMGLQGQSWGGYQTAQLITMTDRYSAAMAGAPVANMFSAYGGIRWGSGLNRQFQYERTQSRIGYTIWERPELYIENSPLFHLPNVTTPLLIMHNDGDGAVPWYQGIELFTGMKRLGKPVWLLNYNDDDHNLMRNANRMDLSIRMRQFFDYYLMGEKAPQWLIEGIPATVKGKELRY